MHHHLDRRPRSAGHPTIRALCIDRFDLDVYALTGSGCMMERVSAEAASVAGHLDLSNLCWVYGNNHITIEGNTSLRFTDDVARERLASANAG